MANTPSNSDTSKRSVLELSNLIKERFACNMSRTVMSQFKPIVEDIFGYDAPAVQEFGSSNALSMSPGSTNHLRFMSKDRVNNFHGGWQLKYLTRNSNQVEYDNVVQFLHPEGLFFILIKSLMTETSAKFEYPVSQFPPHFRSMIENGVAPPYFANKIISTSYVHASHLILNPFEFYMFHFGLYILNTSGPTYETPTTPNDEPAYFTLLKIYLDYFVPLDNSVQMREIHNFNAAPNQQNSIWQSLSSTTTSIFNLATSGSGGNQSGNLSSNNSHPSLFKPSIFQSQTPFNQHQTSGYMSSLGPILYGQGEHLKSLEWRCSTFLLMITELWFGNIPAPKTNYVLGSTNLDELSMSCSIQPFCANIDQMTAVRLVIKHLHYFSNSLACNQGYSASQGLTEIKQAIWTAKYPLQKRLYNFIKISFSRWPMDYTFRQPLEAWLSYIQPWRYAKRTNESRADLEDHNSPDMQFIDNHWKSFISNNLLYYTILFGLIIDRLLQLDLSSSRNALMLFRVIKVYSQPGFLLLLKEAEESVMRNDMEFSSATSKSPYKISSPNRSHNVSSSTATSCDIPKAKLLAPSFLANGKVSTPKVRIGALEHHLMNLESDADFAYVSLFSLQMKQKLIKLLGEVQKSRITIKEFVQSVEVRSKLRNKSWFDSIRSFLTMEDNCFESKDEREMYKDKLQAEGYLNFTTNKVTQCFEIQVPEVDLHSINNANLTASCQTSKIFFNV